MIDITSWFSDPEKLTVVTILGGAVYFLARELRRHIDARIASAEARALEWQKKSEKWEELIVEERRLTREAVQVAKTAIQKP